MIFDWDETKNAINLWKHGVDFSEAAHVFTDPYQFQKLDRIVDGEERWQTIGIFGNVLLLLVVHTVEDANGEEYIRIISARKANTRERKLYEEGY